MQEYENETTGGRCGRSVHWALDDQYVLTISGKGPMKNYNTGEFDLAGNVPWENSQFMIVKIVIEEGVTSVGNFAFIDFASMEEIDLPSTMQKIGKGAFDRCGSLKRIQLPESLLEIEDFAFVDSGLEEVVLPAGLQKVGNGAFSFCRDLQKITILNPDCKIEDAENTLPEGALIVCHAHSAASEYAEKYGRRTEIIKE